MSIKNKVNAAPIGNTQQGVIFRLNGFLFEC